MCRPPPSNVLSSRCQDFVDPRRENSRLPWGVAAATPGLQYALSVAEEISGGDPERCDCFRPYTYPTSTVTRRTTTTYTPASRRERVGAFSGRRARRPFSFRAYRRGVSPLFRTFNWELRSCGLRGHATYAPTERALAERVQAHTAAGTAWRCLRCAHTSQVRRAVLGRRMRRLKCGAVGRSGTRSS